MPNRRLGAAGIRRGVRGAPAPSGAVVRALSGFSASDYYASAAGGPDVLGAEGTIAVVLAQTQAADEPDEQTFLNYQTTRGDSLQLTSDQRRRWRARGLLSSADDFGYATSTIHCQMVRWTNGEGSLATWNGTPEGGGAGSFAATTDPSGTDILHVGIYKGTPTLREPCADFAIVAVLRSSVALSEDDGDAWWERCVAARSVLPMPSEVSRYDASALDAGSAPSTLTDDGTSSANLTLAGSLTVEDVSGYAWSLYPDLGDRAAAGPAGAGSWTGTPNVMCVGDSITMGADASALSSWVELLESSLGATAALVGSQTTGATSHEGVSGDQTSDVLAKIAARMATYTPDLIVLAIGTNDITVADLTGFGADYDAVLDAIFAADSGVIVRCSLIGPRDSFTILRHRAYANAAIKAAVNVQQDAGFNCEWIAGSDAAWDLTEVRANDGTHPTDVGHAAQSALVLGSVRAALDGGSF